MSARHLIIKGKVQGVFYRVSARKAARELGIVGWVKNMPDGSVEAYISGKDQELDDFVAWCRKGPPDATVSDIIITTAPTITINDFTIR